METSIITVSNLKKHFKVFKHHRGAFRGLRNLVTREFHWVRAVDGIGFQIQPGELVGYIGPNGAGKSTTVKVLAGILVPDEGRCEVQGRVPWRERAEHVARIGVVFGQRTQLWWDLPVAESFELLREIYRVERGAHRRRLDELVAALEVDDLLDVPVRQLSLGQRMRCDVVAALLHDPRLLFLDEPTIGLDAHAKLAVRDFVRRLNRERGTTVILTTHDMDDIEALCTRVLVIDRGRISCDGDLDELRARVGSRRRVTVDLEEDAELAVPGATVVERDGPRVVLDYDPAALPTARLVALLTEGHAVRDLFIENPPIEEIVTRLYRAEASPEGGSEGSAR